MSPCALSPQADPDDVLPLSLVPGTRSRVVSIENTPKPMARYLPRTAVTINTNVEAPPGKRVDITHLLVGRTVIGPGGPPVQGGQVTETEKDATPPGSPKRK